MHVTGAKGTKASVRRWQGYLISMELHGLSRYQSVIECDEYGVDAGYSAVKGFLEKNGKEALPEAIYFGADNTAIGGMIALGEVGIRIPEDIRIVGFDDDKLWGVDRELKKLTTIRQPLYEMGKKAAEILLEQIHDPETSRKRIVLRPELIVRETT